MKKTKRCFKCGKRKCIGQFYAHPQMADGYLGKCKTCARSDALQHRAENIESIREYDRLRGKLPHRVATMTIYTKRYRDRFPERYRANNAVNNALRDGKLTKPNACERCGDNRRRITAHHDDYSKPLEVKWYCKPCHVIADRERAA